MNRRLCVVLMHTKQTQFAATRLLKATKPGSFTLTVRRGAALPVSKPVATPAATITPKTAPTPSVPAPKATPKATPKPPAGETGLSSTGGLAKLIAAENAAREQVQNLPAPPKDMGNFASSQDTTTRAVEAPPAQPTEPAQPEPTPAPATTTSPAPPKAKPASAALGIRTKAQAPVADSGNKKRVDVAGLSAGLSALQAKGPSPTKPVATPVAGSKICAECQQSIAPGTSYLEVMPV